MRAGVASDEHHVPHMARGRLGERRKVRTLAEPPRDQHEWPARADAIDGGHRRTDVRPLGVVDPAHAPVHRDRLAAVGKPRERLDRRGHGVEVEPDGIAERERGENVHDIVHSGQRHRVDGHDGATGPHDSGRVPAPGDMPSRAGGRVRAEPDRRTLVTAQAARQRIVEVRDRHRTVAEHAALRGDVFVEASVAIHVVGTEIEHGRHRRTQRTGRFELEARQLEDMELVTAPEQRQRGRTQIAARSHPQSGAPRHDGEERRDGALAVRPGDRDYRRIGRAGEELDVADDGDAADCRGLQRRLLRRQSGTDDDLLGRFEQRRVESAAVNLHAGELRLHRGAPGRAFARVHRDHPAVRLREMANARQPRVAQPDDEHVAGRGRRSFAERGIGAD